MKTPRELFEEDLRSALLAASAAYGRRRFVVVGSASILASYPDAPDYIRRSADIDVFPMRPLEEKDIEHGDDLVGQSSPFECENDFYVERLGDWTMLTQPEGWLERCVKVSVGDVTGFCLHPLDLAYNKTEAGREKDIHYVAGMIHEGYVGTDELKKFIQSECPHEELLEGVLGNLLTIQKALRNLQDGEKE